jgi:hypothetical protein
MATLYSSSDAISSAEPSLPLLSPSLSELSAHSFSPLSLGVSVPDPSVSEDDVPPVSSLISTGLFGISNKETKMIMVQTEHIITCLITGVSHAMTAELNQSK